MAALHYLKQNVAVEPLYNQWYAWWYLVAPTTAPLFVTNLHTRIMQSFVAAPDVHVAALQNPALRGGPYLNLPASRAPEVQALLDRTHRDQAATVKLSQALVELDKLLVGASTGHSLEGLYKSVPAALQGYVELTYDLNHRASARFLEALLYKSPHFRRDAQSLSFRLLDGDARPYVFSTPRLGGDGTLSLQVPFDHAGVDAFFALRDTPGSVDEARERLGVPASDAAAFAALFTEQAPRPRPRFDGDGVRLRYFGHACVLIETREVSVLTDPVVSYDFPTDVARFTHADLPERIDYVVITHGHADHLMLETLLPLRKRIGTIVVPRSNGGGLADPSLKLMLKGVGFTQVVELDELESLPLPGGAITGLPFLGEHCDLSIRAKLAHLVELGGHRILMAADSNAIEPRLYDHVRDAVGGIDILFLGMESEGAPMSWMYGPLLTTPLARKMDQSRRLNGSNAERAIDIVRRLEPKQTYVYAMGREPWLSHVMVFAETEESPQVREARKLIDFCRERGTVADLPYLRAELHLPKAAR